MPPESLRHAPTAPSEAANASRPIVISLALDIVLNASIPAVCYWLTKRFVSSSEIIALTVAMVFPLLKSGYDMTRHREIDPVALLILLGIVTSALALVIGGDPRVLLIRESFFTGAFGILCLVSLTFPRPIMFYLGRYFMAAHDLEKRAAFDARWQHPYARHAHRLVTTVWGCVFTGEFAMRVLLVNRASATVVLVVSPIVSGIGTILTIAWTFWYAFRVRAQIASEP